MTLNPKARSARYGIVIVALLLTGYNGVVEGINATRFAETRLE